MKFRYVTQGPHYGCIIDHDGKTLTVEITDSQGRGMEHMELPADLELLRHLADSIRHASLTVPRHNGHHGGEHP